MDTKKLAEKLVRKYNTWDPFKITNDLGYIVIDTELEGIRGF